MNYLFISQVPFTLQFLAIRCIPLKHFAETSLMGAPYNILIAKCSRPSDEVSVALNPADCLLLETLSSLDFHNTAFTSFQFRAFLSGVLLSLFCRLLVFYPS